MISLKPRNSFVLKPRFLSELVWTMGAHISIKLRGIMFMLTWFTSLVLRWAELQDPPISRVVPTLKDKCTCLGSLYTNVVWRSTSPGLHLCQQQRVRGKEQQLQRPPPTFLHTVFCTSTNTHPVFRRHQWTYFPCKVFHEVSLYLLSPQHCVTLSTTLWGKTIFLFVLNPFPHIFTGIHSSSCSFRKEQMMSHCSSFLILHPSVV